MFLAVSAVLVGVGSLLSYLVWRLRTDQPFRERFSLGPLGLGKRRKVAAHSILDVRGLRSLADYVKMMDSRSVRQTMEVQIDKAFREHAISVRTIERMPCTWEHFSVIFEHEVRIYSPPRAALVAALRLLAVYMMVGHVDEYREGGRLVAFSTSIVKGATLRGMWFYQRGSVAKHLIWHHTARLSIQRAIAMGLHHADTGPSTGPQYVAAKAKYGFAHRADWRDECDYSGAFRYDLPPAELFATKAEASDRPATPDGARQAKAIVSRRVKVERRSKTNGLPARDDHGPAELGKPVVDQEISV
eukprot:m.250623 g.250623  ORF g.250623 m.250623 type:complete len:302 (+) comp16791_c0_seq1:55-960(+)